MRNFYKKTGGKTKKLQFNKLWCLCYFTKLLSFFHKTKNIDMTEFIKKISKKKKR